MGFEILSLFLNWAVAIYKSSPESLAIFTVTLDQ